MVFNSKKYMREYRKTHREKIRASQTRWRKEHRKECNEYEYSKRDQHNARMLVSYHIKKGNLKKEPCEICGCPIVQAHHDDYRYPLQVRWLCKKCHTDWHKSNSPIHGERLDQRYLRRKREAMPEEKNEALEIMRLQNTLEQEESAIEQAHPEVFAQIKEINERKAAVDKLWEQLKAKLIEAGDTDVHEVYDGDYKCTFSLSKTSKVGVVDVEKVPQEFVEVKKVADPAKLKAYYELYGEVPAGCEDKSFYRLNKKIVLDKSLGDGVDA